jgi:Xaa-Pro aminopeptidase
MSIKEIGAKVIFKDNIIDILKAKKNITEENGMRNAHIRDGVALTKFIYWIKNKKNNSQSEISASNYLDNLRSKNKNFFSLSFPTIAGSGPNGAIVHYRASKKTNRKLKKDDLFLVDSGAQYFDGTTDVTRTIAFSKVTNEQKKMYTLVLKGHIAVALSTFNEKESGKTLDRHARKFLKKEKLNFDHGTGHGVGCFLNVHESPPSISPLSKHKFKKGMIVSNEPGFYKKNKYGIRIENLVLTRKKQSRLYFETLTVAPLEPKLIDFKLLTSVERKWLKNYHSKVYKSVAGFLNNKEKMWLQNEINSLTV